MIIEDSLQWEISLVTKTGKIDLKMHGGGNAWMKLIGIKDKKRGRKDKKEEVFG